LTDLAVLSGVYRHMGEKSVKLQRRKGTTAQRRNGKKKDLLFQDFKTARQ